MFNSLPGTALVLFALLSVACAPIEQAAPGQSQPSPTATPTAVVETPSNVSVTERKPVDHFAHLRPEHREVLRRWLKSKPYLRPAVEQVDSYLYPGKDSPEGEIKFLRDTVGENGYQYYSVGDMNHDGKVDFAVLLADTREQNGDNDQFALAIFNAPFTNSSSPAYFEKGLHDIASCYIVFDLAEKKHLFLGKFESDVYCATYYPKGRTYIFKEECNS